MSDEIRLRGDGLEWRDIEGEIVVLDLDSSTYLSINRTGAALWPQLISGATKEELVARLVEAFDVDEAAAAHDLDTFLGSLGELSLLES